jgi:deoxyribonuclease V
VKARQIHGWHVTTAEARQIQFQLRDRVIRKSDGSMPRYVAGADISFKRNGTATAAAVVLSFPEMEVVESVVIQGRPEFPYVPGLLTFREAPLVLEAFERIGTTPDLILVDGQGIAHPRRFGIASHLGLLFDVPTIGCAKSRLCGEHQEPAVQAPAWSPLTHDGELIGAVLRTKTGCRPLYVSIGHRIDLPTAVERVLACCRGYRLPEPTRLAHLAAGGAFVPPVVPAR